MKISLQKLGRLCAERKGSLASILDQARVSRNAFYSMARKDSVLPCSIRSIANCLKVKPSDFLEEEDPLAAKAHLLLKRVDRIALKCPDVERDTIRHMFILFDEKPVERLRRALIRAQKPDVRR